jgi:hypothetical protein
MFVMNASTSRWIFPLMMFIFSSLILVNLSLLYVSVIVISFCWVRYLTHLRLLSIFRQLTLQNQTHHQCAQSPEYFEDNMLIFLHKDKIFKIRIFCSIICCSFCLETKYSDCEYFSESLVVLLLLNIHSGRTVFALYPG